MEECKQEKRLDNLESAINGNGTEGLKAKMVRMEESIKSLKAKMNLNNWLTLALLGTIISTIVKVG
jgi:hypothetical protein